MQLFSAKSIRLFALGIALLVVGYICLGIGPVNNPISKTVAPLILVAVYCGYFPWAILSGFHREETGKQTQKEGV